MIHFSMRRLLRLTLALMLFATFSPAQAQGDKCFGAAGQQCGMFAGGQLGQVAFCLGVAGGAVCDVHGGSWTHDECCAANPNGVFCGGNDSSRACQAEWDKSVSRFVYDYNWVRLVDTNRLDSDGRVNRSLYCAKLGAGLHRSDRHYCCSGQSVRAPWPLSEVRRRLYFCE
ncbi:MAG: hypothetical protein V4650_03640 [Pseudomonadota bacterium]